MKKKNQEPGELRLCPACKQPTLVQATNVSGWLDASMFRCKDAACNYTGRFFITVDPRDVAGDVTGNGVDGGEEDDE